MRTIAIVCLVVAACESKKSPPASTAAPAVQPSRSRPIAIPTPRKTWTRPPTPPAIPVTAAAWAAAEVHETSDAWEVAAVAYEVERDRCEVGCDVPAYAAVLARRNAMLADPVAEPPPGTDPVPVPPRVQELVDALDEFVRLSDPSNPDAVGAKFLAGNALKKWRQPDALVRLEDVLRNHRDHETAEYAANILIDHLLNDGRVAEVRALVDELLADQAFLAGKDELRKTLERVRALIAARE
jgi:hypothetical protein